MVVLCVVTTGRLVVVVVLMVVDVWNLVCGLRVDVFTMSSRSKISFSKMNGLPASSTLLQ